MIKLCSCKHEYQDAKYGKGNRVHVEVKKQNGSIEYRCTVCSPGQIFRKMVSIAKGWLPIHGGGRK